MTKTNLPSGDRSRRRHDKRPAAANLTRDQFALVHIARRQCQMEDESYRQLLQDAAGVNSSAELDGRGFTAVMARFKTLGFVHRPKAGTHAAHAAAPKYGARRGMATDAQIGLITSMWAEWSLTQDASGLSSWLERSYGISNLRFLTTRVAGMAIEGLKQMIDRREAARTGGQKR